MFSLNATKTFVAVLLCSLITGCGDDGARKMAAYDRWKQGAAPYDAEVIEYGLRHDPDAVSLVVGKSLDEVRSMFKDVHEPKGSFSILVSKNLLNRPATRKFYQWAETYVIFEVEADRVVALSFVHG